VHGNGRLSESCSSFHGRPSKFTGGVECNPDLSAEVNDCITDVAGLGALPCDQSFSKLQGRSR